MSGSAPLDYRQQLQSEFSRRRMLNPRFSLRAFARLLGLSPAFLSKVLSGGKNLSVESSLSVAEKLGYNHVEASQFCQLVQFDNARSPRLRSALSGQAMDAVEPPEFLPVSLETFQVISDWYHGAILELTCCHGFKADPESVSQRLGIGVTEAKAALDRLARLGLIKQTRGRWAKTDTFIATPSDQPSRAIRNFHAQMLEKAKAALETQGVEQRDVTGMTLAVSADKIALAKKEIRSFRRRMAKLLESSRADSVYQLGIQFFALDRKPGSSR